uniref:Uncharacterized protein n=1 Tax=Timspurckia oligopyrenoides TaxID=708627 RepID=A0A7S0ZAL5_9RHOD|mmetsp:Transcript_10326/g.18606  ORF Transcript_10326/g.18606 Transcript_10326/m.18606 type:complete len:188 (+) Transcript_10326:471-1034(+)|eukprot:CAMPEP_0182442676 /NCGR_PEP_ID=MMETSP1172-20130603/1587_1 /TAXON_ID=708627 /ORGANISM="Timspurckia oligopyrenoides, Strain CCMP3278" /LENGTH=187 /DNA_ID=CAMNT_0024637679 /DNA_START=121 /DNA_END=684 /DNA_ORIENTATION=+
MEDIYWQEESATRRKIGAAEEVMSCATFDWQDPLFTQDEHAFSEHIDALFRQLPVELSSLANFNESNEDCVSVTSLSDDVRTRGERNIQTACDDSDNVSQCQQSSVMPKSMLNNRLKRQKTNANPKHTGSSIDTLHSGLTAEATEKILADLAFEAMRSDFFQFGESVGVDEEHYRISNSRKRAHRMS